MARIYISSTYQDLRDHREKVYHALRQLSHDVVAMEDYVATDSRPLDQCLRDVASCEIYVGIFAWRQGFIPPGEKVGITELEYREARKKSKTCLIFLLHDEADWKKSWIDRDTSAIDKLRDELKLAHGISHFSTVEELASLTVTAVTKAIAPPTPAKSTFGAPSVGEFVHLMCDRKPQKEDFDLLYESDPQVKVLACAITGRKDHMPESLVQRFFFEVQKKISMKLNPKESACRLIDVGWPDPGRKNAAERQQLLLLNLKSQTASTTAGIPTDPREMAHLFSTSLEKVLMLRHKVQVTGWRENGEGELLRWYLDFWQQAASHINPARVVLFFNLISPEPKRRLFFSGAKAGEPQLDEVRQLFTAEYPTYSSRLLPSLDCVRRADLEEWMGEHLRQQVPEHEREKKCDELMSGDSCLLMRDLLGKLKKFCDDLNQVRERAQV